MQRDFDSSTPAKLIMLCENTIEQQIKQEEKRVITMILKKEGIKTSYVTLTFLSEIEFMRIFPFSFKCYKKFCNHWKKHIKGLYFINHEVLNNYLAFIKSIKHKKDLRTLDHHASLINGTIWKNYERPVNNWLALNDIKEYSLEYIKLRRENYEPLPFIMTKKELRDLDTDEKINKHNSDIQNKHLLYKKNQCLNHKYNIRSNKLVCCECDNKVIVTLKNIEEIYNVFSPWIIFGAMHDKRNKDFNTAHVKIGLRGKEGSGISFKLQRWYVRLSDFMVMFRNFPNIEENGIRILNRHGIMHSRSQAISIR
jgi:hypothetical protein